MALKNIKIFRELIQNCNKLLGLQEKHALSTISTGKDDVKGTSVLSVQATERPCSPLLNLVRDINLGNIFQPQAEQGIVKGSPCAQFVRHRHYTNKELEEKSAMYGKECVPKKKRKCCKQKEKRKCKQEQACPAFLLKECPPGRNPPICRAAYKGKPCAKVFAPYPAYSETCVEYMPENPSECHQCPWRRCENAHTIKVQKIRRKYHTSSRAPEVACTSSAPPTLDMIPESEILNDTGVICDASKKPCKPPPGKCEKRKKLEEKMKKKREAKDKEKKAINVGEWSQCWGVLMRKPVQIENLNPYTLQPLDDSIVLPASTDTVVLAKKKNKPPNCPNRIKRIPEDRTQGDPPKCQEPSKKIYGQKHLPKVKKPKKKH